MTKNHLPTGATDTIRAELKSHPQGRSRAQLQACLEDQGIHVRDLSVVLARLKNSGYITSTPAGEGQQHIYRLTNKQPPKRAAVPARRSTPSDRANNGDAPVERQAELEYDQWPRVFAPNDEYPLTFSPPLSIERIGCATQPPQIMIKVGQWRFGAEHIIFTDEGSRNRTIIKLDIMELDERTNKRVNKTLTFENEESNRVRSLLDAITITLPDEPPDIEKIMQDRDAANQLAAEAEQRAITAEHERDEALARLARIESALGR